MQRLLKDDNQHRQDRLLTIINQRNMGYFDQEVQKLEEWADDLKLGLEQQIKDIDQEIKEARQNLLENFDEEVQSKLNLRAKDSQDARSRFEKLLMAITATELKDYAQFEGNGFILQKLPEGISNQSLTAAELQSQPIQPIQLGRYELPRQQEDAHLYCISHPLAQWALGRAKIVIVQRLN